LNTSFFYSQLQFFDRFTCQNPDFNKRLDDDVLRVKPVTDPQSPPYSEPDTQGTEGRLKSIAALRAFDPSTVLARLSGPT
jgi:hypothetical protein